MLKVDNVNKQSYIPVCCILFLIAIIFSLTCTNTNPNNFAPEDRPKPVSWIKIITGLADTTRWPEDIGVSKETFAKNLNKAGFRVSWNHVEGADYYEIRISRDKITNKNWESATLATTVQDAGDSIIRARIDRIQPSISVRNCTGCQACVSACPRHAITIYKGKAVIDLDSCIGCGMCYGICSFNAVLAENMTKFYYFAVRAFTDENVPAENVTCTNYAYKSRYVNKNYHNEAWGIKWCGFCGAGCYILNPMASGGHGIQLGACPVDAIYYDPEKDSNGNPNSIHIDQSKCISCGLCVEQCGYNFGNWSIRREIISSETVTE